MSIQLPAWSFSALEAHQQCPRKYYHKYILREKQPETEAQRKGNEFDKAIEARLKTGVPLPDEWKAVEPLAASFATQAKGAKMLTQFKMGLTRDFTACGFFDKDVWVRAVIDLGLLFYPTAIIADWKSGKNNESKPWYTGLQLKIFSAILFKAFPRIYTITAFNVYTQDGAPGTPQTWRSVDQQHLWREILPPVLALEEAGKKNAWPEKPGPLCAYCPVKSCQFNKS